MAKALDLTGQRFGRLTVIERQANDKHGKTRWLCKCDCGNITIVDSHHLQSRNTKSCGCMKQEYLHSHVNAPNLIGQRFGRLTVIERAENNKRGNTMWLCRCDCGNNTIVIGSDLKNHTTQSCGCLHNDLLRKASTKHGQSRSRLHYVWKGMKSRCYNKNHKNYKHYGGRGISIDPRWNDFAIFQEWALKNGYDETAPYGQCTLDRIDVNGNYCPENCRWTDMKTQNNNQRKKKETPPAE